MSVTSITRRSASAAAWGVMGSIGKIGGQLIVQVTLARLLGPQSFGQFAAVLVVLSMAALLADFGFGSALIQKKNIDDNDIGLAIGWSMALAIVISCAIVLMASLLAEFFGDPGLESVFRVCGVFFLILPPMNITLNLLRRDLDVKKLQLIHLFAYTIVYGGVSISLALAGAGVWSLVIAFGFQTLFTFICAFSVRRHSLRPRINGDKQMVYTGLKALATDATSWSMENMDQLIIGKIWGVQSLGLYAIAMNLVKAPVGMLNSMFQNVAFSSAARLQSELHVVRNGYLIALSAIALVTFPIFTLLSQNSAPMLAIIYGPKWSDAATLVSILALAMPWVALGAISAAILRGIGAVGMELSMQMLSGLVLALVLILAGVLPLSQALWTIPLVYCARFILLFRVLTKKLNLSFVDLVRATRGGVFLATIGMAITTLFGMLPDISEIAHGAVPLLAGASAIFVLCVSRFNWFSGILLSNALRSKLSDGPMGPIIAWIAK